MTSNSNKKTKGISAAESAAVAYAVKSMPSQDSIADFDKSEWTPEDSSYGAACPVCGCVPKHVRRAIEFSMISALVLVFVYLLVMTSINVSDARTASHRSNSTSAEDTFDSRQNYTNNNYSNAALTDDDTYVKYDAAGSGDDSVANENDDDLSFDDAVFNDDYTDDYNNNNLANDNDDNQAYKQNGGNGNGNNYNNGNYRYNYYRYNSNNNNNGGGRRYQRDRIRRLEFRYLRGASPKI
jgi:hypothetical protein